MEPAPHVPRRTTIDRAGLVLLLGLHFLLLLDCARRDTLTFDEGWHVAGGVTAWRTGDLRILPDIGEIPQRLAGLPLVLAGVEVPDAPRAFEEADAWPIARALIYDSELSSEAITLLARLPFMLASVLLGWLVSEVAHRVFGRGAGWLGLVLYALSPSFLANGHVAAADLLAALTMTASALLIARCLEAGRAVRVVASGGALGLAFVAKMSGVLLLPVGALVALVHLASRAPVPLWWRREGVARSAPSRLAVIGSLVVLHALLSGIVIWGVHGFREAAAADPQHATLPMGGWDALPREGAVARVAGLARQHHLLPEAWLFGFQMIELNARARPAHALGRWSTSGWRWFFPLTLVLKLPLATLVLLLLGLTALGVAWRHGRRATIHPLPREGLARWATTPWGADIIVLSPLLALLLVYWAVALRTPLAIGHRHVLPTLPATLVLASAAATLVPAWRHARLVVCGLALGAAIEGLAAHPYHLAYMNPLAGPPARRWTRLVDSSLDWGQDARRVARFLSAEPPGTEAWISWFGISDPLHEGAVAHQLPSYMDLRARAPRELLSGGTYVISATMLVQVNGNFPGTWAAPYEVVWRAADDLARPYLEADEGERRRLEERHGDDYWRQVLGTHEQLRLARLCAWLRHRPPDAVIGDGAVLAWRLTDAQVEDALYGPPVELVDEPVIPWSGSARAAPR